MADMRDYENYTTPVCWVFGEWDANRVRVSLPKPSPANGEAPRE